MIKGVSTDSNSEKTVEKLDLVRIISDDNLDLRHMDKLMRPKGLENQESDG